MQDLHKTEAYFTPSVRPWLTRRGSATRSNFSQIRLARISICFFLAAGLPAILPAASDDGRGTRRSAEQAAPDGSTSSGGRGMREVPDNAVDEDGDGWLATSHGFPVRAPHPRVLVTPERLQVAVQRMAGPAAREPYKGWFGKLQAAADAGRDVDLVSLALLYKATGDTAYRDKFLARLPTSGTPKLEELFGIDLLFDELSEAQKLAVMKRVADNRDSWYWNSLAESNAAEARWGYHSAIGVTSALAYAGAFAYTEIELRKDPAVCKFNAANYLRLVHQELADRGHFRRIENRIAGDMIRTWGSTRSRSRRRAENSRTS